MVERYDFPSIDFSVTGWDTLWNTLQEMLQDMVVTREVVILGETVVAYETGYQDAGDSKWYKAQADGSKQPCQGIFLEGGDEDDGVRVHRMGKLTNAGWAWASIGAPIYLDPSTAGALTQTAPDDNAQIIGYALSADDMLVMLMPPNVGIQRFPVGGTLIKTDGLTDAINVIVWEAPFACTVTNVKGYRVGGTGATINARRNGADNHLVAALSLINADQWMDGGAVQNTAYAAGNKMEIMLVSAAGGPTQIAIKVDFSRP